MHEPEGEPAIDVMLFHGIQRKDHSSAWETTWRSETQAFWPTDVLKAQVPQARILSVSYDAAVFQTRTQGNMDIEAIGKQLFAECVDLDLIALGRARPVVLVAHSLGGFAAMQLCNEVGCTDTLCSGLCIWDLRWWVCCVTAMFLAVLYSFHLLVLCPGCLTLILVLCAATCVVWSMLCHSRRFCTLAGTAQSEN